MSVTPNIGLITANVLGDGNDDFQTWSQEMGGEVDSNMVKIDTAIGTINGEIDDVVASLAAFSELTNRQGGSATNWGVAGTTNYVPPAMKMQCGTIVVPAVLDTVFLTFPTPFAGSPVVVFGSNTFGVRYNPPDATGVTIFNETPQEEAVWVSWIAVGPK
jgi:hypothetical protein